jgi:serine/threonine protein kinase
MMTHRQDPSPLSFSWLSERASTPPGVVRRAPTRFELMKCVVRSLADCSNVQARRVTLEVWTGAFSEVRKMALISQTGVCGSVAFKCPKAPPGGAVAFPQEELDVAVLITRLALCTMDAAQKAWIPAVAPRCPWIAATYGRVLDSWRADRDGVVMEFVDGRTLNDWLCSPPNNDLVATGLETFLAQTLFAMSFMMNTVGLYLNDIKLDNVMLTQDALQRETGVTMTIDPPDGVGAPRTLRFGDGVHESVRLIDYSLFMANGLERREESTPCTSATSALNLVLGTQELVGRRVPRRGAANMAEYLTLLLNIRGVARSDEVREVVDRHISCIFGGMTSSPTLWAIFTLDLKLVHPHFAIRPTRSFVDWMLDDASATLDDIVFEFADGAYMLSLRHARDMISRNCYDDTCALIVNSIESEELRRKLQTGFELLKMPDVDTILSQAPQVFERYTRIQLDKQHTLLDSHTFLYRSDVFDSRVAPESLADSQNVRLYSKQEEARRQMAQSVLETALMTECPFATHITTRIPTS